MIFHVPWQETNEQVSFSLRLVDEDGRGVMQPGAQDGLPAQVNGHFEARRQPGMTPGTEINVPMSFNIVLHLAPGRRYSWVLDVDGQADDSWRLSFETRQAEVAPPGMRGAGAVTLQPGELLWPGVRANPQGAVVPGPCYENAAA